MAVALSFRKKERTLTDAEVDASQAAVIAALQARTRKPRFGHLDETLGSIPRVPPCVRSECLFTQPKRAFGDRAHP